MNLRLTGAGAATLLIGSVASAGTGGPIIIDDFTSGAIAPGSIVLNGSFESAVAQQSGTMIGGERDLGLRVFENTFNQPVSVAIDPLTAGGFAVLNAGAGVNGSLMFEYDGTGDVETDWPLMQAGSGLDLDLSNLDEIVLDFAVTDDDFEVTVVLTTYGDQADISWSETTNAADSGSPQQVSLALADFELVDLANIDSIKVILNTDDGDGEISLDMVMTNIAVIPAPAAIAMFGAAGLVGRRRRRA